MKKARKLTERLDDFVETWLANPCASADLADLVSEVLHARQDRHPVIVSALETWVRRKHESARYVGLNRGPAGWI